MSSVWHDVSRCRVAGSAASVRDMGEARSAKQTKSIAFRGPNGSTGCRDRGQSKPEASRHGWQAQPARMQVARSAKQTKSTAFRGPNGSTGCQDRGQSKPEASRHGWQAQPARMQVARSAKQTKSTAFRGPNGSTWMSRLGQSRTEALRHGWHEQYFEESHGRIHGVRRTPRHPIATDRSQAIQ